MSPSVASGFKRVWSTVFANSRTLIANATLLSRHHDATE
jgi:hypothetical protein